MPFHEYRIPQLDALADVILASGNETFEHNAQDEEAFGTFKRHFDLYETKIENYQGSLTVMIRLTQPLVISMASDAFKEDSNIYPAKDLCFKKLGLDFQLPFLFTDLTMKIRNFEDSPGAIRLLDSNAEDFVGARHVLKGEILDELPLVPPPVTIISKENLNVRLGSQTVSHIAPANVFLASKETRVATTPKSVSLLDRMTIRNEDITKRAQDIVYKAMLFHMDKTTRKEILNIEIDPHIGDQVGDVPEAISTKLDAGLIGWLKDTYAPAYICMQMSGFTSEQVKEWNDNAKFTNVDKKRIRYWWTGKGPDCLSQSKQYKQLNTLSSAYAARQLLPDLNAYIMDADDGLGGEKWAAAYFKPLSKPTLIKKCVQDEAYFRKVCNSKSYAERSFNHPNLAIGLMIIKSYKHSSHLALIPTTTLRQQKGMQPSSLSLWLVPQSLNMPERTR